MSWSMLMMVMCCFSNQISESNEFFIVYLQNCLSANILDFKCLNFSSQKILFCLQTICHEFNMSGVGGQTKDTNLSLMKMKDGIQLNMDIIKSAAVRFTRKQLVTLHMARWAGNQTRYNELIICYSSGFIQCMMSMYFVSTYPE